MDYYIDRLKLLIEKNNGVIAAGEMKSVGIDPVTLRNILATGILVKESHGNYVLAEEQPDEFRIIQNHSDKLIFSHETALYLHSAMDGTPLEVDITVPQGDNVSRIKKKYEQIRFHYCKKELWDLGVITVKSPHGYDVKTYDWERCICDLIKNKKNTDVEIYARALREYFSEKCNPEKLMQYAKMFNLETKVMTYMEILS